MTDEIYIPNNFSTTESNKFSDIAKKINDYYPYYQYDQRLSIANMLDLSEKANVGTESVPIIISIMNKSLDYSYNDFVTLCEILMKIANFNKEKREECVDAIPLILSALEKWNDKSIVFINILFNIIGNNSLCWRKCAEADGIHIFINILKKSKNLDLSKRICNGLANMLRSPHPDLITPNYDDGDRITKNGYMEVLLNKLDTHYKNIEICENICNIFAYITSLSYELTPEYLEIKLKLIPFLIDILEDYSNNLNIVEYVSKIILNIFNDDLLNDNNCKELIYIIINSSLFEFQYNSNICILLSSILLLIISKNPEYILIAKKEDIINALITVQRNNYYNDELIIITGKILHSVAEKNFEQHQHILTVRFHKGCCDICSSNAKEFRGCRKCDYDECLLCTAK
jgi:hypothetical protein